MMSMDWNGTRTADRGKLSSFRSLPCSTQYFPNSALSSDDGVPGERGGSSKGQAEGAPRSSNRALPSSPVSQTHHVSRRPSPLESRVRHRYASKAAKLSYKRLRYARSPSVQKYIRQEGQ